MKEKSSITSLLSAYGRAYHAKNASNPVFFDDKAAALMTQEEYRTISNYILDGIDFIAPGQRDTFSSDEEALRYLVHTQIAPTPLARAAFCEESMQIAAHTGTDQFVILGAGLDTFAFRHPDVVASHLIFEADHPLTQEDKLDRIRRAGWEIPHNLKFVPVDFSVDDVGACLLRAGLDPKKKTFFSWLGVSYYLSPEQIRVMLSSIRAVCAEGSTLLFDYADQGLFSSDVRRVQNMIAMAVAGGEPMLSYFSEEELVKLLEPFSFLVYELITPPQIDSRWFSDSTDIRAFEHVNFATAVYKPMNTALHG